ncbi:MAG: C-terminal helicase domain-containing protein, partial [Candidatus Fonsibacter sp.]
LHLPYGQRASQIDTAQEERPYEPRETLVCRSWFKVKKQVFNVNYEYDIAAVEGDMKTLSNGMTLPISLINNNCAQNYCKTCHSFQGNNIEESITILDHKFVYVLWKWLYTAVTKATHIKQVYFYDYDESAENETNMIQYFARKVDNYKLQDKKANRSIDQASFITKEWLMGCVSKSRGSCGDCLTYSRLHGKIDCNLTAQ